MGILDDLLGGGQRQRDFKDFVNRYEQGHPAEGYSDQEVADRYRDVAHAVPPDQYAQAGYDSVYLQAEAIKRAGSTDPAKILEALTKSDYVSVAGHPIRFDERNQATPKLYVAVIKDGRRVIVEDIDILGVPY